MATSVPAVPGEKLKLGKSRAICWTLHDYTMEEVEVARQIAADATYMVWGYEECPTTKKKHLQGFVCWENPRSLDKFKDTLSSRTHLEKMRGTHKQASDYCKYDDYPVCKVPNVFEEFGKLPAQGTRTDWCVAVEQISSGANIEDVIMAQPQLLPGIRALERFKAMTLKPKHREVEVIVCYGKAGTGKSRFAWDTYPDLYSKPEGEWWDGYTGQTTILLDDYYGDIPYSNFLKVLDRYPLKVPIKGGFIEAQWDTVIITSNRPPREWYSKGMTPAISRRISKIFYYSINAPPSLQNSPTPPPLCEEADEKAD